MEWMSFIVGMCAGFFVTVAICVTVLLWLRPMPTRAPSGVEAIRERATQEEFDEEHSSQ